MTHIAGIVLSVAIVAAMSTAQAQAEPRLGPPEGQARSSIGPLDFSCGKWIKTSKRTAEHQVLQSWILGFLSGVNFQNLDGDFLQGRDADGLTAWIDNYCRRNPLSATTQAAFELIKELQLGR